MAGTLPLPRALGCVSFGGTGVMVKMKDKIVDLTPPPEVASTAEKGLELRRKYKRGGTNVGVARARDLKGRKSLSPQTIKRMVNFFDRQEVHKQDENFGNEDDPSPEYVGWLLWGGDPGREWAERKKAELVDSATKPKN
ncbi:hypothetical protein [Cereibacter sphaeroides]|nr:hypothetical protein [Cereibacter sphaeroides]